MSSQKVAALYVDPNGVYSGRDDVDLWDETRDARLYSGPWPVVAHPPCARWGQLASVNLARWGTPIGSDDGCFKAALAAVRTYGGVLEHPGDSIAFHHFGLPKPRRGSWQRGLWDEGYVTEVSQNAYGHLARKRTWLYALGVELPDLDWADRPGELVVGAGIHRNNCAGRRLPEDQAMGTPLSFAEMLLDMARSCAREALAGDTE